MVGFFTNRQTRGARVEAYLRYKRVCLKPLSDLDQKAWRRVQQHFRDVEISYLNGTPPNRMPLWFLKRLLKADSRRPDRATYGIFDERDEYIGTIELYDIRYDVATLGIIIGEKSHWSRGYGPEAIGALLSYAFGRLHLERVKLNTFADNVRAQASFKKIGFIELRRVTAGNGRTDVQMEMPKRVWLEHQLLRRA
ncbi:MAG: GNAT family N-acetyltransferase [Trueperaceae bacterium]